MLPPGLTLDPVTGVLSGQPTIPGTYPFKVSATSAGLVTLTDEFDMEVISCEMNPNLDPVRTFVLNNVLGLKDFINRSRPILSLKGNGGLASYFVSVDGVELPQRWDSNGFGTVCVLCPPLTDGPHTVTGREVRPSVGALCVPYTFTVDTVPEPAPIITQVGVNGSSASLKGTCSPATVTVQIRENNVLRGGAGPVNGQWIVNTTGLVSGLHTLYALGFDRAGNISEPSITQQVSIP